jgi:predicted nucleic acid-binding protein
MKKRGRRSVATLPRCVLDSGGLSALIGISQRARAWLRWVVEHDGAVEVPAVVLVETTTGDGGRDAEINRVLRVLIQSAAALVSADEATARRAGQLRFRAGTDDGIDALVAATAARNASSCVLLTSDAGDLKRLLAGEKQVAVRQV